MAKIAVAPLFLRNYKMSIQVGATENNYEGHTEAVSMVPTTPSATWTAGDAVVHTATAPSTWELTVVHVQDHATTDSLSRFLLDNEGATATITFTPDDTTGTTDPTYTTTCDLAPTTIGGTVGAFATSTMTVPCTKPVRGTVE